MHLVFIWYFNAFLKAKESSFDLSHSKAYPEIGLRNVFFKLRFGTLKRDNLKVLVASGNKSVKLGIASKKWQQCGGGNIFAAHPCFGIIFSGRMLTICRLPKFDLCCVNIGCKAVSVCINIPDGVHGHKDLLVMSCETIVVYGWFEAPCCTHLFQLLKWTPRLFIWTRSCNYPSPVWGRPPALRWCISVT